jgi:hypothetical protein
MNKIFPRIVALALVPALLANPIGASTQLADRPKLSSLPVANQHSLFHAQALNVSAEFVDHDVLGSTHHSELDRSADSLLVSSGDSFISTLLRRLEEWSRDLLHLSKATGSRSQPTPWPLGRDDASNLYPFQGRIYQNYYEGVEEKNPDWRRREILAEVILALPDMQMGGVFQTDAIRSARQIMSDEGLGMSESHLDFLLETLVEAGVLEQHTGDSYRLIVEPEVVAVKFRLVDYMKRQLQTVLMLHGDEALQKLLEVYGAISERWPLYAVDARKPFAMAVADLDKKDVERILDLIGQKDLRLKYPVLDNLWLIYDRPVGKDYIREHFPLLEGQDLFTLSPEGSLIPLGGLGRVQDSAVEALDYLAQDAMRIMEGEPYYPNTLDPFTQSREGYEPRSEFRVFTNHLYSRTFKINLYGNPVTVRVYQERRIFGSATSPGAISVVLEDGDGYYANHRYAYNKAGSGNFDEFTMFFANAFLDYWEHIQLEKYDTSLPEGIDYKAGWLKANDAQSSVIVSLLRERQNRRRDLSDPLERKRAEIWDKTRVVQVCHTIINRVNHQTGVDVTAPAMRDADVAEMVSGWHAEYEGPRGDPHTSVVAMFNGSAWHRVRKVFVESWRRQQKDGLLPADSDPDYPTAEQMRIHRTDDKKRYDLSDQILKDLNIQRRPDGSILDPEMPVDAYSGRPMDEKLSLYAAHTQNNLRGLLNRGKGVNVILSLSPVESEIATYRNLVSFAREINGSSKGKLIVLWGNSMEDQAILANIADNFTQASKPKTEANGATEVPAGPNGAKVTTPSGLEGGLQVQLTPDSIIIPESDTEMGFRKAYNQFLTRWYVPELDEEGQIKVDADGWAVLKEDLLDDPSIWNAAAKAVRVSRVNDAKATAAEMLRQIHAEEERIQNPLLALKQYLRGEPGMDKYFNTPFRRTRLVNFLLKHPDYATSLKADDGVVRAFVVHLEEAGRPFVLAVDVDKDYWNIDRTGKKGFDIRFSDNREAFKKLFGERTGEVQFTLWDAGSKIGYSKEHQLEKEGSWWMGVPYPGIQVLVPELVVEDRPMDALNTVVPEQAFRDAVQPEPSEILSSNASGVPGEPVKQQHPNLVVSISVMNAGAEQQNGKIISRNSLSKIADRLEELRKLGVGGVYLYGLWKPYPASTRIHNAAERGNGEGFVEDGHATIRVVNYPTGKAEVGDITLTDRLGNIFSQDMRSPNPALADGQDDKSIFAAVRNTLLKAHSMGMKGILCFIPRLAPGAINATNYKLTNYKELPEEWNQIFKRLPSADQKAMLHDLLRNNRGWCTVTIVENGANRVILVHHAYGGLNVDQVELNPEHPDTPDYLLNALKQAIDLGADEVRADLPHLLLRYTGSATDEPLAIVIRRAADYAKRKGVQFVFNAETYEQDNGVIEQQRRMVEAVPGHVRVYSKRFFDAFWKIAREGASAKILDEAVGTALASKLPLWIYASNFDQVTLRAMGGSAEAMVMLCLAISHLKPRDGTHLGVVFNIDWDDLFLFWGRAVRIAGGGNGRDVNDPNHHTFAQSKEELDIQTDNQKQIQEFGNQPIVKAIKDFAQVVRKDGEIWVDWNGRENEDRNRFYSLSWETGPGEWTMLVVDLKPDQGERTIWVEAPNQLKNGFEVVDPLNQGEQLGRGQLNNGEPTVTGVAFTRGVAYRILQLKDKRVTPVPYTAPAGEHRADQELAQAA